MNNLLYIFAVLFLLCSCDRKEFLETKPDQSLVVPTTLDDFIAMLDRDDHMNGTDSQGLTPQIGESASDDFYLLDANFNSNLRTQMQNYYIWAAEPYQGVNVSDWSYPYRSILVANLVINGLKDLNVPADKEKYRNAMGRALFYRAHMFYQLAQVFAQPYRKGTAAMDKGLPLRLSADINEKLPRTNVEGTYAQILDDLLMAKDLLSTDLVYKTRPSKQAAYGLLARVYQTMQVYDRALLYADSCLQLMPNLLDYSEVDSALAYPFDMGNNIHPEVIYMSGMLGSLSQGYPNNPTYALVDSVLYASYTAHDLRKEMFFKTSVNGPLFRGSYTGRYINFSGIAADEVYLIRAECLAREGRIGEAMIDLNALLMSRYEKVNGASTFIPYAVDNQDQALKIILQERRKELIFRGLRWTDLRRFNIEEQGIVLIRNINEMTYSLPPNDARWTFPIPEEVRELNPSLN